VLIEDSQAVFSNGESSYGSSNAAAYFTGIVCLMKSAEPDLSTAHLQKMISNRGRDSAPTSNWPPQTARRILAVGKNGRFTVSAYPPETIAPVSASRRRGGALGPVVTAIELYAPRLKIPQGGDEKFTFPVDRTPADLMALFPHFPQEKARVADDFEYFL